MNERYRRSNLKLLPAAAKRHRERSGLALALGFGVTALLFDVACERFKQRGMKRYEALSDGGAHIATALACALPAAPFVEHRARFVALATISAVAIDLDHVVAARSTRLISCMTMPHRPASHSMLTVSAVSYIAERIWPGTQSGLALAVGLGSHLLRDLATGGAPLFLPKRIVAVQRPPVASMMIALGFFGRWYARRLLDPERARRSNPLVLAPEAFVVGTRAVRALRDPSARPLGRRAAEAVTQLAQATALSGDSGSLVDAIILNHRTPDLTVAAYTSLIAGSFPTTQLRIWIVDNGSNDGSVRRFQRDLQDARVVASSTNLGFAAGNNLALGRILADASSSAGAHHRYVLLLNSDTDVEPDALSRLVRFMDGHTDVGVAGPRLLLPDGSLDLACRRGFPTPSRAFWKLIGFSRLFPASPRFAGYNLTHLDEHSTTEVDAVVGACMLVRLSVIERVGLLDDDFFMYGEDLDWCYRIKARGWRIYYVPQAVVHHYKGASSRRRPMKMIFEFYRAMWLFHRKHYAARHSFLLNWLVMAGIIARGVLAVVVNTVRPTDRLRAG